MTLLDECLYLSQTINEYNEQILEFRSVAYSPRNQVLNGMPRGEGTNTIEQFVAKIENLEKRVNSLKKRREKVWNDTESQMIAHGATESEMNLMLFRFYCGYQWRDCCNAMKSKYPNELWNENKCFRVYRSILTKLYKI